MRQRIRLTIIAVLAFVLTGCTAKTPAPAPAAPALPATTAPAAAPAEQPAPATPAPQTANDWSDKSYAYLNAEQWQEALDAAKEALKLEPKHPGALYNAGMALLGLNQGVEATRYLSQSAALQPERFEPHVGLARAHTAAGRGELGTYHLEQAVRLAPTKPDVSGIEQGLAVLMSGKAAQIPGDCAQRLDDGAVTVCVAQSGKLGEQPLFDIIVRTASGQMRQFTLGAMSKPEVIEKAALPGGVTGYWVGWGDVGPYVHTWRLFVLQGDDLHQVIFTGGTDIYVLTVDDHVRSWAAPRLIDGKLIAYHRHDADPSKAVTIRFTLDQNLRTAAQEALVVDANGK